MNDIRAMLAETAARLFADHVTPEVLQRAEDGGWPSALWQALEDNGLTRVLVPEAEGGVGGTWEDAFVLLHAAGRAAAPVPLGETILAGWLLAGAGVAVPDGPIAVAPVRDGETLRLLGDRSAPRLEGQVTGVPWGGQVEHLLALADHPEGPHLVLVDTRHAERTAAWNMAHEPRDGLAFAGVPVTTLSQTNDVRVLYRFGALLRSAQLAGGIGRLLELSVGYAGERTQFGRPIGRFQAVQHLLAVLAEQAAAAGMAAETACRAAARGDAAFEIAVAKVRTGEAAARATAIAHEVHGAIGFTYEHVLHFTTRRLWSWRTEFGAESQWAAELGREALARGADALWPALTARD